MQQNKKQLLYEEISGHVISLIEQGVLKEGVKIPSIREMSSKLGVSINTVKESYLSLENRQYIEAVPQSGFYVKKRKKRDDVQEKKKVILEELNPVQVSLCSIYGAFKEAGECSPGAELGIAVTSPDLWPGDKFYRYYQDALRLQDNRALEYCISPGYLPLRQQLSMHLYKSGLSLGAEEIIITNGCSEALFIALHSICSPGDTIAIESPIYFNLLHLCEHLKLNILEIPNSPSEGMSIQTLEYAFEQYDIKAVITIPSYSNPTGSCMSVANRKRLVELVNRKDVPLVEDAIYSELSFSGTTMPSCKSFDREGNVIYCSSFSKVLAPGIRVGWIIPGKYYEQINTHKSLLNIGTSALPQMAVSRFLAEGGIERLLRTLRRSLKERLEAMSRHITLCFPEGTRISNPEGGFLLWVELPEEYDTLKLYRELLEKNIIIAPGAMFTMTGLFSNCMRLNAGIWSEGIKESIEMIGETIRAME